MRREAIRAFEIAMILQGEFMMRELSSNQTVMINVAHLLSPLLTLGFSVRVSTAKRAEPEIIGISSPLNS
jgi:hypothetical protein